MPSRNGLWNKLAVIVTCLVLFAGAVSLFAVTREAVANNAIRIEKVEAHNETLRDDLHVMDKKLTEILTILKEREGDTP